MKYVAKLRDGGETRYGYGETDHAAVQEAVRDKGAMPLGIERRSDGTVYAVHHAGEHYVASDKVGTNVRTGKPVTEYQAQGDALRLWLADDLSFADED